MFLRKYLKEEILDPMENNRDFERNTVPSKGQIKNNCVTFGGDPKADFRILFVGNSITRHGIAPQIGWHRDCGMAASDLEKDYVHLVVSDLERRYGKVCFCIAQLAEWEWDFGNETILHRFDEARDFAADLVVIRIGENVSKSVTDSEELAVAFEKMIRYFAVRKDCRILVTDLFWHRTVIDDAIERARERVGGIAVKIGDLGEDDTMKALGEYEHHGVSVHPSDKGMAHIAQRILEKI